MATIPELLDGHVTLEVECLDRLYLNGYIGKLATGPGLVFFMRDQLGKPIPSPVVLGQISERFREAVKVLAEQEGVPVYQFRHKETERRYCQPLPAPAQGARRHRFHWGGAGESAGLQRQEGQRAVPVRPRQDGLRQSLLLLHR